VSKRKQDPLDHLDQGVAFLRDNLVELSHTAHEAALEQEIEPDDLQTFGGLVKISGALCAAHHLLLTRLALEIDGHRVGRERRVVERTNR
jgi:hypothetical protein